MKRGYVLKEKSKDQKKERSKKNIKYEPHKKKTKIDPESVAHSNATTLSLLYANKIVCSLSKMPQFMMIKQFNLDSFMLLNLM